MGSSSLVDTFATRLSAQPLSKLKAAKVAERYDLAICSGKGQPTEAVRTLFERAEGGDYQLFVFHDADLDGYDIARVMAEETRRMPGYSVDVVDIGLTIEDAVEMGLEPEPFFRKKNISLELHRRLSPLAKQYLCQPHPLRGGIGGERFELNAILPDTRRIDYIEGKLEENGVRGKVMPTADALKKRCEAMYREKVGGWVDEAIGELLQGDELKEDIGRDRSKSWRGVLDEKLEELYKVEHEGDLRDAVRRQIRACIAGDEEA